MPRAKKTSSISAHQLSLTCGEWRRSLRFPLAASKELPAKYLEIVSPFPASRRSHGKKCPNVGTGFAPLAIRVVHKDFGGGNCWQKTCMGSFCGRSLTQRFLFSLPGTYTAPLLWAQIGPGQAPPHLTALPLLVPAMRETRGQGQTAGACVGPPPPPASPIFPLTPARKNQAPCLGNQLPKKFSNLHQSIPTPPLTRAQQQKNLPLEDF